MSSTVFPTPHPTDIVWDDLRFPSNGLNPIGSTAPPAISTTTGLLTFAGGADNIIAGVAQMPHAWKAGSSIYPHIHVLCATSNAGFNTRWKFEYNRANNNEAFENAYGTYSSLPVITEANPGSGAKLVLNPAGFGELPMVGYRESCCILWRVSRLAASDAADNDTNDWVLVEFDIHYQLEKLGTQVRNPA